MKNKRLKDHINKAIAQKSKRGECQYTCRELGDDYDSFNKEFLNRAISYWHGGGIPSDCLLMQFDYDGNGKIDIGDILYIIDNWGQSWRPACSVNPGGGEGRSKGGRTPAIQSLNMKNKKSKTKLKVSADYIPNGEGHHDVPERDCTTEMWQMFTRCFNNCKKDDTYGKCSDKCLKKSMCFYNTCCERSGSCRPIASYCPIEDVPYDVSPSRGHSTLRDALRKRKNSKAEKTTPPLSLDNQGILGKPSNGKCGATCQEQRRTFGQNRTFDDENRIVSKTTPPAVSIPEGTTDTGISGPMKWPHGDSGECCERRFPAIEMHKNTNPPDVGNCENLGALWTRAPEHGGECLDNKKCTDVTLYGLSGRWFEGKSCNQVDGYDDRENAWRVPCTALSYENRHEMCGSIHPSCQEYADAMAQDGHPTLIRCGAQGGATHEIPYVYVGVP